MRRTMMMTASLLGLMLLSAVNTDFAAAQEAAPSEPAALLNPDLLKAPAPDAFQVKFATSKGDFVVQVRRDWAPNGADRFYNLVKSGYYDGCRFFRVVEDFMAQFGIHTDPKVNQAWMRAYIPDDPVRHSNTRGSLSYAFASPNTRATQVFINFADNSYLDGEGFAPFGTIVKGMDVVDAIYNKYGETPDQTRIQMEGQTYLEKNFPNLDSIQSATILTPSQ